jgi:hypothetical protein
MWAAWGWLASTCSRPSRSGARMGDLRCADLLRPRSQQVLLQAYCPIVVFRHSVAQ